ncbi:MAG: HAMP domain-containing histidine kinase [Thermodesulfovibrionales bacterium]|nr:HAMP domain-containing histidine kinase [Thermodesulfovibrionales bacterium]
MNGNNQKEIDSVILEYFYDNASVVFFCCNENGIIVKTNRYTENIIGKELIDKTINHFFVDFHNAFKISDFINDSKKVYLLNITTKSGLPQTYYFRFFKLQDLIIAIGETDIEETENLRRHLVLLNNELNNKTRELMKANKELEKLNNIKNQLLGMAAHDLRTPVGAIRSYSEFLLEETAQKLDVEHVHFLITIKSLSDFMLRLLNDLLDVSIIESGRITIEPRKTDMVSLIKESIEILEIFANRKSIQIAFSPPTDITDAYVDPIRIRQVIDNLLNNAIKFSPQKSTVVITLTEYDEDRLKISIADEGKGIALEDMDKLFKPFSQASSETTGGERKTGLGLSIAKKIIDAHGGKIFAKNRENGGSEFYFLVNKAK